MISKSYREWNQLTGRTERVMGAYLKGIDIIVIARGFDDLNPTRTPEDINQTLRHEVAHEMGYFDTRGFGNYTADEVADMCG